MFFFCVRLFFGIRNSSINFFRGELIMDKIVVKKLMKSMVTVVVLCLCAMIITTHSKAANVKKSGDYSYRKTESGVVITNYTGKGKKVKIPDTIDGKKVVEIGDAAFEGNKKIKSVIMPDTITQIGGLAFAECSKLKKVTLSNGLEYIGSSSFSETGLVSVVIPDNITEISFKAFMGCEKLEKVTLSSNTKIIQENAFANCSKLSEINFENIEDIRDDAFKNNVSLKGKLSLENVVEIHDDAFYGCTGITEVEFSDKLQLLGTEEYDNSHDDYDNRGLSMIPKVPGKGSGNPFSFCNNIEKYEVDINNANYKSADGVIYGKSGEWIVAWPGKRGGQVIIPKNVIGIARYAFSGADITSVVMNSGLNYIGKGAFAASDITEVHFAIPETTMRTQWSDDAFYKCKMLKKVVFPEGITQAYDIAFIDCTTLTKIVLPESMTKLSSKMFLGCEKLETVKLPDNITTIPAACFYGCKALKNINMENVDDIHVAAFYDCDSFAGVLNLNVTKIEYASFGKCDDITKVVLNKALKLEETSVISFFEELGADNGMIDNDIITRMSLLTRAYDMTYANPFVGCTKLQSIITNEAGDYKAVNGVLFSGDLKVLISYPPACTGKYNIPYGTTCVAVAAFEKSALTEVVCSNTVLKLDNYSFSNTGIKKITVSKSVKEIGAWTDAVFEGSKHLEEINVHASNKRYESIDGVLYRNKKKGKVLEVYPAGRKTKKFVVPKKTYINETAFSDCTYLKKIYITDMKKRGGMSYGTGGRYVKGGSGIKIYLAENFKPSYISKCAEDNIFKMGFGENCTKCKTYVKKKSVLAKMLNKKKIKYNTY